MYIKKSRRQSVCSDGGYEPIGNSFYGIMRHTDQLSINLLT